MANLELVTYCGLYCGLCSRRVRAPQQAKALQKTMHLDGWDKWELERPNFKEFWALLAEIANSEGKCDCRGGKRGPIPCVIRSCAIENNIEVCPFCVDYPCNRILGLSKGYTHLLGDGQRMKEIGLDAWVQEQEERATTGFAYPDIRCYPYSVPND